MRWFAGLPIPIETACELAARAAHAPVPMDRARLLLAEDLHLTLRFFGQLAEERVAALGAALGTVRQEAFRLELTGVGAFRSVGALYAGVAPSRELASLAEAVNEALAWHGFPRELRPFHPHVTLARVRRASPQAELNRWSAGWTPLSFVADRLALFRSREKTGSPVLEETGSVEETRELRRDDRRYDIAQTLYFGNPPACDVESL